MTERLPPPDESLFPPLARDHVRTLDRGLLVGRIHATAGAHPTGWNEFRYFGPTTARFDHQPEPRRLHPSRRIMYAAAALPHVDGRAVPVLRTCVSEVFRERGAIELSRDAPYFVLFRLARPVRLLDLVGSDWVTLAGSNAAISSGPRRAARDWARAIYRHYPSEKLDGLFYSSSQVPSARSVALFERAANAMPPRPEAHLPLSHPSLRAELEVYAGAAPHASHSVAFAIRSVRLAV